jgi:hypothetical protein
VILPDRQSRVPRRSATLDLQWRVGPSSYGGAKVSATRADETAWDVLLQQCVERLHGGVVACRRRRVPIDPVCPATLAAPPGRLGNEIDCFCRSE